MHRVLYGDAYMPVDTGTAVPPAIDLPGVVDPYSDNVLGGPMEPWGEVVTKSRISVRMNTERVPVNEHLGIHVYAFEKDGYLFALPGSGRLECLPVPAYSGGKIAARAFGRVLPVGRTFYAPIVRQVDVSPCFVVEIGFVCRLRVAKGKSPVVVEERAHGVFVALGVELDVGRSIVK